MVEWLAERGLVVERSTVYRWVQRFLPLFSAAARAHRHPVGATWRVDETYLRLQGRWTSVYRATGTLWVQDGQVVDASCSECRNAQAAQAFFDRALTETGVVPERVDTDKAQCYPPAQRAVLPAVKHRRAKYVNNGLARDQQHFKQRIGSMRGFKNAVAADTLCRGHALIQNVRTGFSRLTATVPRALRLMTAWSRLAQAI